MRKLVWLLPLVLLGLLACSNEVIKEENVLTLLENYKKVQYTIKDPANPPTGSEIASTVEDYLSDDVLKKHEANRVFYLASNIAEKTNKSMELKDIKLKKDKENDNGTVNYKYTLFLKLGDGDDSEIIEKKGELTVSNENGLKITRDWEEKIKMGNQVF